MTPAEAGRVLALAAAYDNRQAGQAAALAWAQALDPGITVDDAQAAVVAHYRDSREWVMPADVNRRCRALRAERIRAAGHLPGPQDLVDDPAAWQAWRLAATRAIGDGATREQASAAAWRAIGRTPPPALPETRRRRLTPETRRSD